MSLLRRRYSLKESGIALAFLAPALAVFVAFGYYPFARAIGWGTYESRQGGTYYESVGLSQYWDVLTGSEFRAGVWHSVEFMLYTVPAGLVAGVVLAVAADRRLKGIRIFQTIFSSTIVVSGLIASVTFFFLINPSVGLFEVNWLRDPDWVMFGVSLPAIWTNTGISFVIVLAGLQAIPEEVVEASQLDGYGPVRRFFTITLPLISPVLMFLSFVLLTIALQAFAEVDTLTEGGPNGESEVLLWKITQRNTPADIGVGSVMSVGMFLLTAIVGYAQFVMLEKRVHYER